MGKAALKMKKKPATAKNRKTGKVKAALPENQVTLDDALELAQRHHALGNLLLAERTYRDILLAVPSHFPSVHYLGIVLYQRGNLPEALQYLRRATEVKPKDVTCWTNYGAVLCDARRNEDALAALDRAVKIKPGHPEAQNNRSHCLWLMGRYADAEKAARRALSSRGNYPDAFINLGNALASQKKIPEAIEIWKKVLKKDPKNSKALNNIGNALRELGKTSESEKYCRRALKANDKNAEAMNNLGNVLLDQGKTDEADAMYRKSVALAPHYAQAHNNMAIALMNLQRYDEALTALRYAVSFKPDYADAYGNMSVLLREMGNLQEAETSAQKAVILNPKSADHYIDLADVLFLQDRMDEANAALEEAGKLEPDSRRMQQKLAGVLERLGRVEEALVAIDKAIKLGKEIPDLWIKKAQIYHIAGRTPEALKAARHALELKPGNPGALSMLAEIHQTIGEMKEADKMIRQALKIADSLPGLYFTLGKSHKFKRDEKEFKKLLELEKRVDKMPKTQACTLHFALFGAYEDVGDYKKAFVHLKKGNDIKRSIAPFKREQIAQGHNAMKKIYTRKLLKSFEGRGYKSDLPVFIIGMPRSGTTLTEQVISSHPQVFGAGELSVFNDILRETGKVSPDNLSRIGKTYVERIRKLDPTGKAKRITDKMPGNYMRLADILSALPDAKIIHCRRDAVDTSLSCYKQLFARGQYWSYDLEELAEQYHAYEDLMEHWRRVLPGRFLEVDYEETVNNFEEQARRMIDFVGLEWNDACLSPHKQKRAVLTASKAQVIKPVYTSSVKGWKRYEKEMQPFVKALASFRANNKKKAAKAKKR